MSNKGKFLFNLQKKKGKKNSGKRLKKKKIFWHKTKTENFILLHILCAKKQTNQKPKHIKRKSQ